MPKWHHLDSSRAMSAKQDSVKKTLKNLIPCPLGCKVLIFAISGFHLGNHLEWHHLDYSRARSAKQDSVKKNTLKLNSMSSRCKILIFAISGFHLGYHLKYIKMLNDAKVASLGFFKGKVCLTRFSKEKKNFRTLLNKIQ